MYIGTWALYNKKEESANYLYIHIHRYVHVNPCLHIIIIVDSTKPRLLYTHIAIFIQAQRNTI